MNIPDTFSLRFFLPLLGIVCAFLAGFHPLPAGAFLYVEDVPGDSIDRRIRPPHPPHPPFPIPIPPPRPIERNFPLELREQHVEVEIHGQVATTRIEQLFHNPLGHRLEGVYLYPLPPGAALERFSMDIDGKPAEAELLDAEKARGIYEDIVRKSRDPALMEYSGQNVLRVRVFPVEPHEDKRIRVVYTSILPMNGGIVEFTCPLRAGEFSPVPVHRLTVQAEIHSGDLLKSVYSPSHEVEVVRKSPHHARVGLEAAQAPSDRDFQLLFTTEPPGAHPVALDLLTHREPGREGGWFLLLLSPGAWEHEAEVLEKDVVFVLDTSGSMRGPKLQQAKNALQFCLDGLREGDRFNLIRYSTEAEAVFEGLMPADETHRRRAREFVSGLEANGGTAIEEALLRAVASKGEKAAGNRPFQVIFLTDGLPTVGERDPDRLVDRVRKEIGDTRTSCRIFSFGIGTDVNTRLLDRITEETKASSEYVLPEEDIEVKVSRFFSRIARPVLANLSLRSDGPVRLHQIYPGALPDLFQGQQLVVLGRFDREAGGDSTKLVLEGDLRGSRTSFDYPVRFAADPEDYAFIPHLWAFRRVGFLLDEIRRHGENPELREEVVALARRHGIVTPYTSYLILEDEDRRNVVTGRRIIRAPSAAPGKGGSDGEYRFFLEQQADSFRGLSADASGSGASAFGAARSSANLQRAAVPEQAAGAWKDASYGAAGTYAEAAPQPARFIDGKTFYFHGESWVDSEISTAPEAPVVRVVLGSDAWLELSESGQLRASWLSIGPKVSILSEGDIYEIGPES